MLTQTTIPGSDDWWLMRLASQLGEGFPRLGRLRSYRDGTCLIPDTAAGSARKAWLRFADMSRLNMGELIVTAATSRENLTGFRTTAADDDNGDAAAWNLWTRSHMQVQFRDLLDDKATYGRAYATVLGGEDSATNGTILCSSPWATTTDSVAGAPWSADGALTAGWLPAEQVDVLTLYRPGYFRRAVREAKVSSIPNTGTAWMPGRGWTWAEDPQPMPWAAGRVPVVELANPRGAGEFEHHTDALDRVNHTILQRLIITAMQAFRQRAIKGNLPSVYPDDDPLGRAGQKIDYDEIYKATPAALWSIPSDGDIWESSTTDITPVISAAKEDVKNLAAVTSTPLYVLAPDAASGSAEGAALARETLVTKVDDRVTRDSVSCSDLMALCFLATGDTARADPTRIETMWQPTDRSSLTERAAAAQQATSAGMPWHMVMELVMQLTPAQMAAAERYRAEDQLMGVLSGTGSPAQSGGTTGDAGIAGGSAGAAAGLTD